MENKITTKEISTEELSIIIDKYFPEKTAAPIKGSDTNSIKQALNVCKWYTKKSELNRILIEKGYLYKVIDFDNYNYNIPYNDINVLSYSKEVLDKLSRKTNRTFSDYRKLPGNKDFDLYKYKFKYTIKDKFKNGISNKFSENEVYKVIAIQLGLDIQLTRQYIETFNTPDFPEIPEEYLLILLKLFDIERNDCFTNEI